MKNMFWIIILLLIQTIQLEAAESKKIRIVSTANVHGETDPCGWKKKPLGGLARKATIIDELRSEGFDVLVLDAGNLFFKTEGILIGLPSWLTVTSLSLALTIKLSSFLNLI